MMNDKPKTIIITVKIVERPDGIVTVSCKEVGEPGFYLKETFNIKERIKNAIAEQVDNTEKKDFTCIARMKAGDSHTSN